MQIESILQAIDEELNRLREVRGIVAMLLEPAAIPLPIHRAAKASRRTSRKPEPVLAPVPTVTVLPPRKARERRPRKRPEPERGALASTVPIAPVVVAPPAIKAALPAPVPRHQAPLPGSFGALVQAAERELSPEA